MGIINNDNNNYNNNKVWDNTVTSKIYEDLPSHCNNNIDRARLKAAGAAHAGD